MEQLGQRNFYSVSVCNWFTVRFDVSLVAYFKIQFKQSESEFYQDDHIIVNWCDLFSIIKMSILHGNVS